MELRTRYQLKSAIGLLDPGDYIASNSGVILMIFVNVEKYEK